ncbi:MAG: hypothetical protein MJK08_03195 [Campylobacterales bacterium]|nr:hypothetical protein [Campylobacterales bacterium]
MKKILISLMILTSLLSAKNTISQRTFKLLKKVQVLSEKKEYKKALAILNPFINKSKNAQAKVYAYQALANIYINKDEYKKVASIYIKIINLDVLKDKDLDQMKFSLSQIYLSDSLYKKSLKYSFEVINSPHLKKSSIKKNIALAYYYDKKYVKSCPYIKRIIKSEKEKESWYRMLYSAYVQSKDYPNAIYTLKYMTSFYSKNETYWMQLISLYQLTNKSKKTLATMELAYKNNYINKKDNVLYFINLLVHEGLYNKVSLIMEESLSKGILENNKKNFSILLSSYLNSKNYIKSILLLKTSAFANSDKYKIMIANIYYNDEKYKKTIKILKNHRFKKLSKYEGNKYILLSLSSYELNNNKDLRKYLNKAKINKYVKNKAINIIKSLDIKI